MRVIIVGAGPAGLTLAHALTRAGINDFVILEKRQKVVEESGNGLGLWPHSVRVLDQLGLLDSARSVSDTMKRSVHIDSNGNLIAEDALFDRVETNHGHPFMMFERMALLRLLHDNLSGLPQKILTGKTMVSLKQDDSGVEVACADGTSYYGDILIGADGVHSAVRKLLWSEEPNKSPFVSSFRGLVGLSTTFPGVLVNDMVESHSRNFNLHYLAGPELTYWFIYLPRESPSNVRTHYSQAEAEQIAEQYAHIRLSNSNNSQFSDLWQSRRRAALVDVEEGILQTWYDGRVALLGDSCHKMTPNLAFGANNSIESVVALVNNLRQLQTQLGQDAPTTLQITESFAAYQKSRYDRAKWCVEQTGMYTRFASWSNWLCEILGRYLIPYLGAFITNKVFVSLPRDGLVLDFVAETDHKVGSVKWKYGAM